MPAAAAAAGADAASLLRLPEELLLRVLAFCGPRELCATMGTCAALGALVRTQDQELWRRHLAEAWRGKQCPESGARPWWRCRAKNVRLWAPEFGGRNGFPPPEKNELVLSINTGCADTVPFQSKLNTPF